jgi:hypothetical protein
MTAITGVISVPAPWLDKLTKPAESKAHEEGNEMGKAAAFGASFLGTAAIVSVLLGGHDASAWIRTIHGSACSAPGDLGLIKCPFVSDSPDLHGSEAEHVYLDVCATGSILVYGAACFSSYDGSHASCGGTVQTLMNNNCADISLGYWGNYGTWDYYYVATTLYSGSGSLQILGIGVSDS